MGRVNERGVILLLQPINNSIPLSGSYTAIWKMRTK
jgi:hypothetical protein